MTQILYLLALTMIALLLEMPFAPSREDSSASATHLFIPLARVFFSHAISNLDLDLDLQTPARIVPSV